MRSLRPQRRLWPAIAVALIVAACGSNPTPSTTTASSRPQTPDWLTARVEQPAAIEAAPTNAPVFCSPCHPDVGTYITSLVKLRNVYYAIGYMFPPAQATIWTSTDGNRWRETTPADSDSAELFAAVADSGGIVAVGLKGRSAAAWRTVDGSTWTEMTLPSGDSGVAERATAIARVATGYVAAGYLETSMAEHEAIFWRSLDGMEWTRVDPPPGAGPNEVTGLAGAKGSVVAVGIAGDPRTGTAAAWRSKDDGVTWERVSGTALGAGRMEAVTAIDGGYVAVGELQNETGAEAWTSQDGTTWKAVDRQPALENGGDKAVMTAITSSDELIAVGWRNSAGNGSGAVWTSRDGRTWSSMPPPASFSGGGMSAVLADTHLVAGGTIGWPDTHAAQIWLGPAP